LRPIPWRRRGDGLLAPHGRLPRITIRESCVAPASASLGTEAGRSAGPRPASGPCPLGSHTPASVASIRGSLLRPLPPRLLPARLASAAAHLALLLVRGHARDWAPSCKPEGFAPPSWHSGIDPRGSPDQRVGVDKIDHFAPLPEPAAARHRGALTRMLRDKACSIAGRRIRPLAGRRSNIGAPPRRPDRSRQLQFADSQRWRLLAGEPGIEWLGRSADVATRLAPRPERVAVDLWRGRSPKALLEAAPRACRPLIATPRFPGAREAILAAREYRPPGAVRTYLALPTQSRPPADPQRRPNGGRVPARQSSCAMFADEIFARETLASIGPGLASNSSANDPRHPPFPSAGEPL